MKSSTCIFTIASKNYLSHVRTLLHSVKKHHPDIDTYLVLCDRADDGFDPSVEPFKTIKAEELGIERWPEFSFKYTCMELNTAVKPFAINKFLRERGYQQVVFLDPDITVYRPLSEMFDLLQRHGVVLTPHITDFLPDDGRHPTNVRILQTGTNNLGFIAIRHSKATLKMVDWWREQLYDQCRVALAEGVFVDQKWMDLTLSCVESSAMLRHPGYNVAYWNLGQRKITCDKQGDYLVNGEPLAFFHFSGFSPDSPKVVSKHQDRLAWHDLGRPGQSLFDGYRAQLLANGYDETKRWPYAYGRFADGLPISDCFRIYAQKHVCAKPAQQGAKVAKSPARALASDDFQRPLGDGPLTVAAMALYEYHPDLQAAFPQVPGKDTFAYAHWFTTKGGGSARLDQAFVEPVRCRLQDAVHTAPPMPSASAPQRMVAGVASQLLRHARRHRALVQLFPRQTRARLRGLLEKFARSGLPPRPSAMPAGADGAPPLKTGMNVFGNLSQPTGVGEAARGVVACLASLGVPVRELPVDQANLFFGKSLPADVRPDPRLAINYCHLNADCTEALRQLFGQESFAGRFNIGFWAWELEQFPGVWDAALSSYQEIWAPSAFVQQSIGARARIPVVRIPHCIRLDNVARNDRKSWGLPADRPVILCMFDAASYSDRKNPEAAIEAVKRAGIAHLDPLLVIKVNQPESERGLLDKLEKAVRPLDCRIINRRLSRAETLGLISTCDMLVSLHRSEGFGLILAEAMGLGRPVVATAYSGNTDFMTAQNSCPVDFKLVTLRRDIGPYPAGARWAEPNVEHASVQIRKLLDDREWARQIGQRAAADIATHYSVKAVSELIRCRMKSLGFPMPTPTAADSSRNAAHRASQGSKHVRKAA